MTGMREVIYSKFSNERARAFSTRTDLIEEDGKREVIKTALYPEGEEHIRRLADLYPVLSEQYRKIPFLVNLCAVLPDRKSVQLEYLEAETLYERLNRFRKTGREEMADKEFITYMRQVESCLQESEFHTTPEFEEVFGHPVLPEGMHCASVTNIDMVCQNLVMTPVPTVIDYEWTFDFPVPDKYVLYRVILYYCEVGADKQLSDASRYCELFGITDSMKMTFRKMERSFQSYITGGHIPVRDLYESISPGMAVFRLERPEVLQVFFLTEQGYTEEQSVRFPIREGRVFCTVDLPAGCTHVRVDPGSEPCMVSIIKLAFDHKEARLTDVLTPGGFLNGRRAVFAQEDPNISHIPVPKNAKQLEIRMTITRGEKKVMEKMAQLEMENQRMKEQLHTVKESKIWKMVERTLKMNSQ